MSYSFTILINISKHLLKVSILWLMFTWGKSIILNDCLPRFPLWSYTLSTSMPTQIQNPPCSGKCFTRSRLGLSPQINVLYILCNSCIHLISVKVDVKIQNIHSHYSDRNVNTSKKHLSRHSCRTEWKFIKEHKCLPKHPLMLAA